MGKSLFFKSFLLILITCLSCNKNVTKETSGARNEIDRYYNIEIKDNYNSYINDNFQNSIIKKYKLKGRRTFNFKYIFGEKSKNGEIDHIVEYDKNGNIIKDLTFRSEWEYFYDQSDNIIEQTLQLSLGKSKTKYQYNSSNKLISKIDYLPTSEDPISKTSFNYDNFGNLMNKVTVDVNNNVKEIIEFEYSFNKSDSSLLVIFSSSENKKSSRLYFDSQGNLTKTQSNNMETFFKYDKRGLVVESETLENGSSKSSNKYEYY